LAERPAAKGTMIGAVIEEPKRMDLRQFAIGTRPNVWS